MPYAWVFNLDADFELAHGRTYTAPAKLIADLAPHVLAARTLMQPGDVLVGEGALPGRAWCPTPKAIAIMKNAGVTPEPHPSVEVLRRVNHRRFACELSGGLAEQAYVETRAELERVITSGGPWLLKRPLTFAGRGQLRITGSERDEAWIEKSLARDGLVVEPLVTPSLEVSLHGRIGEGLGRICVHNGIQGRLARDDELTRAETRALRDAAERTADALKNAGYFGPFGIDAYRCERGFVALSEINARYTMTYALGYLGR